MFAPHCTAILNTHVHVYVTVFCVYSALFSLSTLLVFVVDAVVVVVVIPHLLFRDWKTRTRLVGDAREEKLGPSPERERGGRKDR